jgi:hypothetical protein
MEQLSCVVYLVIVLEISSAIIGTVYYKKNNKQDTSVKYLVLLLWINVLFEIFALLPYAINTFEELFFLKNTIFDKNTWLFNISILLSYILYILYFRSNLNNKTSKKGLTILVYLFIISTISNLIFSDVFFNELSTLTDVFGSLALLLSVLLYFHEVLLSEKILVFYKLLAFYIAIGALVFHLVITPIDIYFQYSKKLNSDFFKFRSIILYSANIFMYTCYIIGFIVCLRKNKSY